MYSETEDKQIGVAIAIRHAVMKKQNVGSREGDEAVCRDRARKGGGRDPHRERPHPPETSRQYDDGDLEVMWAWAQELNTMAGDMCRRPNRMD